MKRLAVGIVATIFLLFSMSAAGRMQAPATASVRGSVEGTVVDSVTGQPIEGAQVAIVQGQPLTESGIQSTLQAQERTLQSPQVTRVIPPMVFDGRTLTAERTSHAVVTDARGKFVFTGLVAAAWGLALRADGYTFQVHGEKPNSLTWLPLNVREDKIDVGVIRMNPHPRISGRVVDLDGRPIVGIPVYLLNAQPNINVDGEKRYRVVNDDISTDADGRYVLDKVAAGRYYLAAGSSGRSESMRFSAGDRTGVRMPAISPFPYSFHPGVPDVTLAGQFNVPPGGKIELSDLVMTKVESRTIRGRVVDSVTGKPPDSVRVSLNTWFPFQRAGSDAREILRVQYDQTTGVFEASNLIPGHYRVDAALPRPQNLPAQLAIATIGDVTPQSAFQLLELRNADVQDLVLTVPSNNRVTGKVVVADGKPFPVAERNLPIPFQLMLRPLSPAQPAPTVTSVSVADGTFEVGSGLEGKYRFSLGPLRDNYLVSEVRLDGVRVTNGILDFPKYGAVELILTLSPGGEIQGSVVDKQGQPVSQAQGILLPDPLPETIPFYQTITANATGRFVLSGVPPGNYKIYAWQSVAPSQYFDRELLRRSSPHALAIHIEKGPAVTASVQIIVE